MEKPRVEGSAKSIAQWNGFLYLLSSLLGRASKERQTEGSLSSDKTAKVPIEVQVLDESGRARR